MRGHLSVDHWRAIEDKMACCARVRHCPLYRSCNVFVVDALGVICIFIDVTCLFHLVPCLVPSPHGLVCWWLVYWLFIIRFIADIGGDYRLFVVIVIVCDYVVWVVGGGRAYELVTGNYIVTFITIDVCCP